MRGCEQAKVPAIMARELVQGTDFRARAEEVDSRYTPARYTAREAHWLSLDAGGGTIAAILAETNHLASACGVEERHPFYDPRVVAYCLALPPEQKLHQGWTRMVLRRSMEGILPDVIRWRTDKADLSPNFYRNLLQMEQASLDRLVTEDLDSLAPYINLDTLHTAHERRNGDILWQALILSRWLRQAEAVKKDALIDRPLQNPYIPNSSYAFSGLPPS